MVIGCDGNKFFCPVLTDDIFVQLFLDLMGSRNIVDRKDRLFRVFLFLFDFRSAALSESASVSEDVAQVEKTDGRAFASSTVTVLPAFLFVRFFLIRVVITEGTCHASGGNPDLNLHRDLLCGCVIRLFRGILGRKDD